MDNRTSNTSRESVTDTSKKGVKRPAPDEKEETTPHSSSTVGYNGAGAAMARPSPREAKIAKPNPSTAAETTEQKNTASVSSTKSRAKEGNDIEEGRSSDSRRVEVEALSSMNLSVGERLEVLWVLEEGDKSIDKWWGCSLAGAVVGKRDESGNPVFTLHYDAFQQFEEADHNIAFIDAYRLVHLEDGAEMTWKKEGQEVDQAAVMASLDGQDVDLQEVMAVQAEEDEEEGGESTESRGMKELAQLPFHQQSALAEGFRRMTDVVKGHLRKKMEQQGGGEVVVSAEDVENMFREVRAGGAGGRGV